MKKICLAEDSSEEESKAHQESVIDNREDRIFQEIFKEDDKKLVIKVGNKGVYDEPKKPRKNPSAKPKAPKDTNTIPSNVQVKVPIKK